MKRRELLSFPLLAVAMALPPAIAADIRRVEYSRDAYRSAAGVGELAALIRASISGRELAARGFAGDVEMALQENASQTVPRLIEGAYRAA